MILVLFNFHNNLIFCLMLKDMEYYDEKDIIIRGWWMQGNNDSCYDAGVIWKRF